MLSYYGEQPWLALPYDGSEREAIMDKFQVGPHDLADGHDDYIGIYKTPYILSSSP